MRYFIISISIFISFLGKSQPERFHFSGRVMDAHTNSSVVAQVYISELNGEGDLALCQTDQQNGHIPRMQLLAGKHYRIYIKSKGFVPELDTITGNLNETVVGNYRLQPLRTGVIIRLEHIHFQRSTSTILPASNGQLNMLFDILKDNPSVKIEIGGHTDSQGSSKANLALSKERADKIKSYLTAMGIKGSRIKTNGYGSSKPIATNDTEASRQLNRRVEFKVL